MTPEEKAEFDQLKADKAALEQEVADLKKRKKKADVDGGISNKMEAKNPCKSYSIRL